MNTPKITHLFRPINLLIIGLTMYFLRWGLLKPMLKFISNQVELEIVSQITELWFALLVLSVVLIAAGGYIINDIRDIKEDKLNHGNNPVGKLISAETATKWYQVTTILGLALGFGIGSYLGNYNLGIIQLTAAISLWFYSNYFKTEFVIGNLVVAFVLALVPLLVGIYEVTLIQVAYTNKVTLFKDFNFNFLAYWFMGYAGFVFLISWAREVLKDIEDMEGDRQIGARTLPIQWGANAGKILVSLIYVVVLYALYYVKLEFLTDPISASFIIALIILILFNLVTMWLNKEVLFKPSSWNKILSLIGVFYLLALGYIIENQLFFGV
jgi:4-hydroxybenzoate polyprenyltransferase